MVISLVALVAVGPQKLPGMLKTMGQWMRKLRQMTMDVRQQTGIDEMLRAEGIQLSELRSLMRGYHAPVAPTPAPVTTPAAVVDSSPAPSPRYDDPYAELEPDPTREYPLEGADAYGALPDDLLEPAPRAEAAAAPGPAVPAESPATDTPATDTSATDTPTASFVPPPATEPAPIATADAARPVAPPEPKPASAPSASAPSAPPRSLPPPPPSRSGVPRPSTAPPPPPRRPSAPPRPDSSSAASPKSEAAALSAPPGSTGKANGNG